MTGRGNQMVVEQLVTEAQLLLPLEHHVQSKLKRILSFDVVGAWERRREKASVPTSSAPRLIPRNRLGLWQLVRASGIGGRFRTLPGLEEQVRDAVDLMVIVMVRDALVTNNCVKLRLL